MIFTPYSFIFLQSSLCFLLKHALKKAVSASRVHRSSTSIPRDAWAPRRCRLHFACCKLKEANLCMQDSSTSTQDGTSDECIAAVIEGMLLCKSQESNAGVGMTRQLHSLHDHKWKQQDQRSYPCDPYPCCELSSNRTAPLSPYSHAYACTSNTHLQHDTNEINDPPLKTASMYCA